MNLSWPFCIGRGVCQAHWSTNEGRAGLLLFGLGLGKSRVEKVLKVHNCSVNIGGVVRAVVYCLEEGTNFFFNYASVFVFVGPPVVDSLGGRWLRLQAQEVKN